MNAICVSRCVQQLLHPLIAHLSLLANPVCVIPAGSSPPDSSVLLQLDKILLWCPTAGNESQTKLETEQQQVCRVDTELLSRVKFSAVF